MQFLDSAVAEGFSTDDAVLGWIQEIAPYGIFTTDRDMRVRSWNQWLVVQSGQPAEKVVGRSLEALFPDLAERRLLEPFARAIAGEVSMLSTALHKYLLPFPQHAREGEPPIMLQTVRIAPLRRGKSVVGTITIIEDVTQREHQALILQRQQEIERLLSSSLAVLLQSADPAREIADIFLGIAPVLGLDAFFSYLLAEDRKTLRLNASGGISPKQRETCAILPVHDSDRVTPPPGAAPLAATLASHERTLAGMGLRAHGAFPLVVNERVIGLVSFGSYERRAIPPGDLKVLSRIASYVAIALDRALREREMVAASRAKDDFLAALSHELRTPLNPVLLTASECVQNPEYSESAREAFRVIEKNALLEARLIDDLLDLTRIEHGKIGLDVQPIDVHATVRDALAICRSDIDSKAQKVVVKLDAGDARTLGDAVRVQQIIWNFLRNAAKFTPVGGTIEIRTGNTGAALVWVEVSDTGIGFNAEALPRMFTAFEQGGGHITRQFGGLGLGLAISRSIAEAHGGTVHARSGGIGQGATFRLELPLRGVAQPAGAAGTAAPASGDRSAGLRILLVEDHRDTRLSMEFLLRKGANEVVSADSAEAALELAAKQTFDVVITDLGLPDRSGLELMKELRDRYGLKGIATSGYGMEEDIAQGRAAGFVHHFTKPVGLDKLRRALAEWPVNREPDSCN